MKWCKNQNQLGDKTKRRKTEFNSQKNVHEICNHKVASVRVSVRVSIGFCLSRYTFDLNIFPSVSCSHSISCIFSCLLIKRGSLLSSKNALALKLKISLWFLLFDFSLLLFFWLIHSIQDNRRDLLSAVLHHFHTIPWLE